MDNCDNTKQDSPLVQIHRERADAAKTDAETALIDDNRSEAADRYEESVAHLLALEKEADEDLSDEIKQMDTVASFLKNTEPGSDRETRDTLLENNHSTGEATDFLPQSFDPASLLDPAVYSEAEIEEDILGIKMDKDHAESMIEQMREEYDARLDEAAEAPDWKKDYLLVEVHSIEQALVDWKTQRQHYTDKLRFLRAINTFRRQMAKQKTGSPEIVLRSVFERHMRTHEQVTSLFGLFTDETGQVSSLRESADSEESESTTDQTDTHEDL